MVRPTAKAARRWRPTLRCARLAEHVRQRRRPHDESSARAPASLHARCSRLTVSPDEPNPVAARGLLAGLRMARMPGMPRMRRWVPLLLAASLVLAVGATFIYGMTNRLEAAFVAQLTVDHTKCFIETKPGSWIDAHEAETRLVSLYGWDIPVPPGSSAEQIELVDVRRCMYPDDYMAHLLPVRASGARNLAFRAARYRSPRATA